MASDDRDAVLDLQTVFTRSYDEGGSAGKIDYQGNPPTLLTQEKQSWLDQWLVQQKRRLPHDQVARAAYYLWQKDGCPQGRHQEHWYRAIEELKHKTAK
jgi:hypothetical protein